MHGKTLLLTVLLAASAGACGLGGSLELDDEIQTRRSVVHARHMSELEPPPVVLLRQAMRQGDLLEDTTMRVALEQVQRAHDGSRHARAALRRALAGAAQTREVKTAAFSELIAAVATGSKAEAQALAHALDVAHGLLAPQGRQAAVDGLSARQPAALEHGDERRPGPPPPNPAMDLFDALELDSDQHRAVRQSLGHPPHPRPSAPDAFQSFARDDFDASALGIERDHLRYTAAEATAEVELVAALVAVIDDDQLLTLCEFMRGGFVESSRSVHG